MAGRALTSSLYILGIIIFHLGGAGFARWLGRKNPKVLLYHDCSTKETAYTADLDCTTTPSTFAKHLDYLCKHHTIVDLETIVTGRAPVRAVAITFDDGYQSFYDNAFPLLRRRQIPATVYLISDVIENRALVWVNELNFALRLRPDTAFRRAVERFAAPANASAVDVISHCRLHYDAQKMRAMLEALRADFNLPEEAHAQKAQLYLSWTQIEHMAAEWISFGNHTRTHPNLERLSEEEQFAEMLEAQVALSRRLPSVRSFAYPFGHRAAGTAAIAARVGFTSVCEVGGYNNPVRPLQIGRVHMSQHSVAGLFARMEVVEPVKGLMRDLLKKIRQRKPLPTQSS